MQEVLIVNDDGSHSPGIRALLTVFAQEYDLTVVTPMHQQSWIGKASSYHKSLRYEVSHINGLAAFLVEGTPSDCAAAGIYCFCRKKPDLLVSGINIGANVGDAYILSSGTVGGALEGAIAGIPSIAVGVEFSPSTTKRMEFHPESSDLARFQFASRFIGRLAKCLLTLSIPPSMGVINVNFAEKADESSEVIITRPARYSYGSFLALREGELFHGGAPKDLSLAEPGTDMAAIRDGKISISMLSLPCFGTYPRKFDKLLLEALSIQA